MNTQDAILQGLLNNTTVGQTGITKLVKLNPNQKPIYFERVQ